MCRERLTRSVPVVAVGYARTATPSPRRVAYWRVMIRAWCAAQGHRLVVVPVDVAPGLRRAGPGLAAVLDIAALDTVTLVVVPSLYHLSWSPGAIDHLYRRLSLAAQVIPLTGPSIVDIRKRLAKGASRWGSA